MNNLTLRQLRYFSALARHRHFRRAAEDCAISQPALSMQIRELEQSLGLPLLERGARQIRLTAFGEDFLARSRSILQSVEELGDLARAAQGHPSGSLRLGVIPTVAPYLLPAIVSGLAQRFPDLEPSLRETVTPRLIAELIAGKLDAAIVALPMSEPALEEIPLFTESFVLVRPASDAQLPVPDPEHLREMRLLLLEEGHCFRDQALSFCSLPASRPREMLDGSSLATLVQMVGAGIGVTLIPEMAVAVESRAAPIAIARFRAPEPCRTIGMVWRRSSPIKTQLGQIADAVRSAAQATADATAEATAEARP